MNSVEISRWWADVDSLPDWWWSAFSDRQATLPGPMKWGLCLRSHSMMSATTKHTGLTMSTYLNAQSCMANPSIRRLAADTTRQPRTVRGALRELVDNGWLHVERVHKAGGWDRNTYTALLPEDAHATHQDLGPVIWQKPYFPITGRPWGS